MKKDNQNQNVQRIWQTELRNQHLNLFGTITSMWKQNLGVSTKLLKEKFQIVLTGVQ